MIAIIANYNQDKMALEIQRSLDCASYIVDSSGKEKVGFIKTDTAYGVGCVNKANELFLNSDHDRFLFICSDIIANWREVTHKINRLQNGIGVYSPSVYGKGWSHQKPLEGFNQINGLYRDVPFCEGMIYSYNRKIAEKVGVIDYHLNKHCYGVDIYIGFLAKKYGYRCVIDDNIKVYHPFGISYNQKQGELEFEDWCKNKGTEFYNYCKTLGLFIPFYKKIPKKFNNMISGNGYRL